MSETSARWIKSTYSNQNGDCVESRFGSAHADVRDSKRAAGPHLTFPAAAWSAMLVGLTRQ
ncbi:DUF397 domain-containing protein [Uniformispora flossi]|uniref:DUF397 domain-containing protein n=1 Tax=Uniformispora flossi TaxID=3390723 RepID=UPI003C2F4A9F